MRMDLDEIKRLPIKEVASRLGLNVLKGNKAKCFGGHDKRTLSLSFMPAKNRWKCYGCGLYGDTIELVVNVLDCDFKGALEWLANEFKVNLPRERNRRDSRQKGSTDQWSRTAPKPIRPSSDQEENFFPDPELYAWLAGWCGAVSDAVGLRYLRDHGIPPKTANKFEVRELVNPSQAFRLLIDSFGPERVLQSGLAWGERGRPKSLIWTSYTVLFPFRVNGTVSFLQGRRFNKEPKYLNPYRIAKPFYNIDGLRLLPTGSVIHVCEGVPDTLTLEGQGIPAIGILGATSFRPEWVDYFMRYDVVLAPDGDEGGERFRRSISSLFAARGKAVRIVCLPSGKDVGEVVAEMRGI